ncbi:MAG: hypothetical protein ACREGK_15940 [Geminicoccales bacterium]
MNRRIYTIGTMLVLAFAGISSADAKDYNKRPFAPPSAQAKINNVKAKIFVILKQTSDQGKEAEKQGQAGAGDICFDSETGVAVDRSNPRQDVIVATKDIINLGGQLDLGASCR